MNKREIIELIKERDKLFIKSQHLSQDNEELRKQNTELQEALRIEEKINQRLREEVYILSKGKASNQPADKGE